MPQWCNSVSSCTSLQFVQLPIETRLNQRYFNVQSYSNQHPETLRIMFCPLRNFDWITAITAACNVFLSCDFKKLISSKQRLSKIAYLLILHVWAVLYIELHYPSISSLVTVAGRVQKVTEGRVQRLWAIGEGSSLPIVHANKVL